MEAYLKTLNIDNLKVLNGFHNTIYEGIYKGEAIIVRISNRRTQEEIEEEITVLNKIKDKNSIIEPFCVEESYVKSEGNYVIAFFKKIQGLNWYETTLTKTTHYNAGKALGTLHLSLQLCKHTKRSHYYDHPDLKLIKTLDASYEEELNKVLNTLKSTDKSANEYGLIHGDYLFSNLMYHEQEVTIIDFDDCEHGYYLYDIAVYLFYLLLGGNPLQIDKDVNVEVFKHFIEGYLSVNTKTILDFSKLKLLFRLRQLKLLATIQTTYKENALGPWQKAYVKLCLEQFQQGKDFIDIPYESLYEAIEKDQ